jgi:hypothetical protein
MEGFKKASLTFHANSVIARDSRIKVAQSLIYRSMSLADAFSFVSGTDALADRYVRFGIEGEYSGETIEGLFDFLTSREGTSYENNGLAEKGVTLYNGVTMPDFISSLMQVLEDGYY